MGHQGKRIKFIQFKQYKEIDGVWVAHQLVAETKRKKKRESQTVMQYSGLKLNDPTVSDDQFSQRGLEKGNPMSLRVLGLLLSLISIHAFAETEMIGEMSPPIGARMGALLKHRAKTTTGVIPRGYLGRFPRIQLGMESDEGSFDPTPHR